MWVQGAIPGRSTVIAVSGSIVLSAGTVTAGDDGPRPEVRVWRDDGAVEIEAAMDLRYSPATIWDVVLDHDGFARYMPNIDSSRVLGRSEDVVWVRRVGGGRFIFKRTYRFELEFERISPDSVIFRQIAGDLAGFSGSWTVIPGQEGVHVRYRATLAYGLGAPWFLGGGVLRKNVRKMLPAIHDELVRRHSQSGRSPSSGEGAADQ